MKEALFGKKIGDMLKEEIFVYASETVGNMIDKTSV